VGKVDLEDVLRRAARREPEALDALIDLYSGRVYGLIFRLCGSRDVAEDLLQETFLRVVRNIDAYEHTGKFESWLFRIAGNLARDRARRGKRRGRTASLDIADDSGDAPAERLADVEPNPVERLDHAEARDRLVECLDRLPDAQREILLLRHYSGLSFAEIAKTLGIPLGTALARAHRALGRLRAEYEGEG